MKRLILAVSLVLAAAWSMGAMAAGNIGVVDMQKIFSSSPQVKSINTSLKRKFSGRKDQLVKMGKGLQQELKTYQKDRSVMGAKDLDKLKAKITKQEIQLRQAQAKFQQELFAEQNKRMNAFVAKVKDIVREVAAKEGLSVVLPKNATLYTEGNLDITSKVQSKL